MAVENHPAYERWSKAYDNLKATWERVKAATMDAERHAAIHEHDEAMAEYVLAVAAADLADREKWSRLK